MEDAETLEFGTIVLTVDDIGPGEAIAMSLFRDPRTGVLFTGDLMDNDMQGFLFEQRTAEWLGQLAYAEARYAHSDAIAYPGHGAEASLARLITEQRVWL